LLFFSPPEEILLKEKTAKCKSAEMTKQALSKWGGVIVGSVHCPVGHFPVVDCGTQQRHPGWAFCIQGLRDK